MPADAKDTMTTNHYTNLKKVYDELEKLMEECKKADKGRDTPPYTDLQEKHKAAGDLEKKVTSVKAGIAKMPLSSKEYTSARDAIPKLIAQAKKQLPLIKAYKDEAVKWTVTVDSAVSSWASKHSDKALDRVVADIEKVGLTAGGLRKISGSTYDVKCSPATDYRIVGTADVANATVTFSGVYRHGPNGGKEHVAGKTVSGY